MIGRESESMKTITDKKRIGEIFTRGTVMEVLPSKEEFMERLMSGERLKMYIGFDPTFAALHLGHAKNIMFMEELRQLGHEIIILFGDFTAMIGDPSDKNAARKRLTAEEVADNAGDWIRQISSIIDFKDKDNPARVEFNSRWLSELNFTKILDLASNFTVQQLLERDMFAKRLKDNTPIYLHEFMYPLMQGYDSVVMEVDAEICGTDQIFNALAGRTLLKRLKNKDKFVVALNLLANPKTGELMSKSQGTGVFINVSANELYGSVMALPDPMIEPLFVNCTRLPMNEKEALMARGPRVAKAAAALDIVKRFHGAKAAEAAEASFNETFAKGGVPDDIQEVKFIKGGKDSLVELLIKASIVSSKTEWRRLINDGAVKDEEDEKITDANFVPGKTMILKVGKRRFMKVVV